MKIYKIASAPAGERWHSAKTGLKDFTEVELPKDGRAGMAAFLNGNEREAIEPFYRGSGHVLDLPDIDPLQQAELRAVAAAQPATTLPVNERPISATDIERFILDRASVEQTEDIFATLGTRFKEFANGTR